MEDNNAMTRVYCSPVFVDFSHMQDSLESAYVEISDLVNAYISPVGIAWKKVLEESEIILHSGDDSHPNLKGSYLAACVFYSVFWKESPVGLSFNAGLNNNLASYLQQVADTTVFYNLNDWNHYIDKPSADFSFVVNNDTVEFTNLSESLEPFTYFWEFGDETTSNLKDPTHVYSIAQDYSVKLTCSYCTKSDTVSKLLTIYPISADHDILANEYIYLYPNPLIDNMVVSCEQGVLNHSIEIFNINGQSIYSISLNEGRVKILSLGFLHRRLYYLSITDHNSDLSTMVKIVKN